MDKENIQINLREIDFKSDIDCRIIVNWVNNRKIKHLIFHFPNEKCVIEDILPEDLKKLKNKINNNQINIFFIIEKYKKPIGFASIESSHPDLINKNPETARLFIIIGEEGERGRGIGKVIMNKLENIAVKKGIKHLEIGAFEFNKPALALYKKMGYSEIKIVKNFTFWKDRKWDDIRMIKSIEKI